MPPIDFAVTDKEMVATVEKIESGQAIKSLLVSSEKPYIDHFTSIFNELWNGGVNAEVRIKAIEDGVDTEVCHRFCEAIEIRKQGMNFADLSSHLRLYNYFRESGANQDEIESFIAKVHSGGIPQDKLVEYVNQLYGISMQQSIALEHVPGYVKDKLEEKQKIDQEIKDAKYCRKRM